MRHRSVRCVNAAGSHAMAYWEWGPARAARTVVCAHGLTRTGRDFDPLARALAEKGWRVVCPDVAGRGRSDWLSGGALYGYPQYVADMTTLLARLDCGAVDWIGTSMGGLIGMMLAAGEDSPIRSLAMNDVGPLVPAAALRRIGAYLGKAERFADLAEAEAHLRTIHAPFGELTADQWAHLARHSVRTLEEGGLALHYDPAIAEAFKGGFPSDVDLWALWERVTCPVMAIRGETSDLLLPETFSRMAERAAPTETLTVAGCGHAPALMSRRQIEPLVEWVSRQPLTPRVAAAVAPPSRSWREALPPCGEAWPWKGGHLQTVRNRLRGLDKGRIAREERLEFPMEDGSGDILLGALTRPPGGARPPGGEEGKPLAVLLHGLTGCEDSRYVLDQAVCMLEAGYPVLRLNLRGSGPSRALCRGQYHAGRSEDVRAVLHRLDGDLAANGLVAVGFSLGANVLLKMLGEDARDCPLRAAVSICAPIDLAATQRHMALPRNAVYQRFFVKRMVGEALEPISDIDGATREALARTRTIREFDSIAVAPRNGFGTVENYYESCSAEHFLGHVGCASLVVMAANDPLIPIDMYRRQAWGRNPNLVPLITERGGHCGYHAPGRRHPWSAVASTRFLDSLFG